MERHVGTTSGTTHRFRATARAPRSDARGLGRTLSLKNTLRQAADIQGTYVDEILNRFNMFKTCFDKDFTSFGNSLKHFDFLAF